MPELVKSHAVGPNIVSEISTLANGEKRAEYKTLLWLFGSRKVKPGQYMNVDTTLFREGVVNEYRVQVKFDPSEGVKASVADKIRDSI